MTEWNREQQKVIDSRKLTGQILVSAAAGSGKTAVLVERIIMSLLDTVDGEYVNDIDDFLVVTFTRAAAAQMKDKITREIGKYLDEESAKEYPDVRKMEHLMRQQIAVGRADICTLDSFSGKVVRENFNVINIDPGFTTVEGNMMKLVKDDILDEMFGELFTGKDGKYVKAADFMLLAKVFFMKTDDAALKKLFYKITSVAETMPEPIVWLEESRIREGLAEDGAAEGLPEEGQKKLTDRDTAFNKLPWVGKLMDYIRGRMSSVIDICDKAIAIAEKQAAAAADEENTAEISRTAKQMAKLIEDRKILQTLYDAADKDNGGNLRLFLKACSEKNFAKNNSKIDDPDIVTLRSKYSKSDGELTGFLTRLFGKKLPECDSIYKDIFDNAAKWIDIMVDFCLEFMERVMAEKHRLKQYEFGDIAHFALQILTERETDDAEDKKDGRTVAPGRIKRDEKGYVIPSKAAKALSNRYKYIYIDEYQDSSYIQEDMINAIATYKDGVPSNIFMVGDVKQSIYKFRQASPKLFVDKYNAFRNITENDEEDYNGMVINLSTNYRSRRPVLDAVNRIFCELMKKDIGGIDYDDNAALKYGAGSVGVYDDAGNAKVELTIIAKPNKEENPAEAGGPEEADEVDTVDGEFNNDEYEAAYVAEKISSILSDENYMVYSKEEGVHRVRPSDIVILSRSIARRADYYVDALSRRNIGVSLDNSSGYFDAAETVTMISMLRVIDNRRQDIPLAAVLNSPIGGLSNSDLMMIAGSGDHKSFYDACEAFMEKYSNTESADETERCRVIAARLKKFFDMVDELSEKQRFMSISMLIRRILELTEYDVYASALPLGQRRLANLNMLMQKADAFEKSNFTGLFNFLRYIDKCRIHDIDFAEAEDDTVESDKVTIMSIHKSKGLEFPVVFLVGLGHEFNTADDSEKYFVDGDNHIAVDYFDPKRKLTSGSFMMNAFVDLSRLGRVEEEQRLLYVGMTRARERLYMTGVDRKYLNKETPPMSYKTRSSLSTYLSWIEPVLSIDQKDKIDYSIVTFDAITGVAREAAVDKNDDYQELIQRLEDASALDSVRRKADEVQEIYDLDKNYIYKQDVTTRAKMSVSEIKKALHEQEDEEIERYKGAKAYFGPEDEEMPVGEMGAEDSAAEAPVREEIDEKELAEIANRAAKRGTLVHKLYELIDFKKISSRAEMEKEIGEKLSDQFFSDEERCSIMESYDIHLMSRFADTELFRRMKEADTRGQLFKEAEFTMGVPADASAKTDGIVIVQGIIDGYFIDSDGKAVIMDYKTDRTHDKEELIRRHGPQLKLYTEALSGIRGVEVKELIIYSLEVGEVPIP
ncbi:MAG: helicase-exonuclease AddAB subunit AddA [Eubacterium sp.]|nr:helicase-exonuclease AddAB subunit AddA [Eubacterium sp.]